MGIRGIWAGGGHPSCEMPTFGCFGTLVSVKTPPSRVASFNTKIHTDVPQDVQQEQSTIIILFLRKKKLGLEQSGSDIILFLPI